MSTTERTETEEDLSNGQQEAEEEEHVYGEFELFGVGGSDRERNEGEIGERS